MGRTGSRMSYDVDVELGRLLINAQMSVLETKLNSWLPDTQDSAHS
jgi:hypothetical protein